MDRGQAAMLHLRSSKLWQLVLVEFEVWSVVADAVFFRILCTAEVLSKRETAKKSETFLHIIVSL